MVTNAELPPDALDAMFKGLGDWLAGLGMCVGNRKDMANPRFSTLRPKTVEPPPEGGHFLRPGPRRTR